jgi:hypothetical protein
MRTERILAAAAIAVALSGCLGEHDPPPASKAAGPCHVTTPGGDVSFGSPGFDYGNGRLGVALWPGGVLVAGPLPDGSSYADVMPDGSIVAKLGWWRAVEGRLSIAGQRLDAAAPSLRADVPAGYGSSGFQATGLTFPTPGCWRVIGSAGRASLTFVVLVRPAQSS